MTASDVFEVMDGGLASIQDAGRRGWARLGVPPGGACDPRGLAIANVLLDNSSDAPAIEIALGGFAVRVRQMTVVAIGGADLGAVLDDGRRLSPDASHLIHAGQTIRFGGRPASIARGVRAYLAVSGGVDVPRVLGSASTSLVGGFGGFDGRLLRTGDVIRSIGHAEPDRAGRRWPDERVTADVMRVVAGPHLDRFATGALDRLLSTEWTIRPESDRMGLRLDGPPVPLLRRGDLVSLPMTWGAIQVPADGAPIALLADHQTVGGYPVIALAIRADRPILGQAAPGDKVRFEFVDIDTAHAIWRDDRAQFAAARQSLATDEPWSDTWRWAGS
jgi:antagonist of KipI